jgi:carbon-monoxide dehydrogenase large subunit
MVVERSGDVVFRTPIIEQGSGMLTVFRQMAAEALDIPLDQVRVEQTMEGIDYDRGVGGSRVTRVVGKMIGMLSGRLQKHLAALVAAEFGHEVDQVTIGGGGFRTPDGRFHTLAQAAALADAEIAELVQYELDDFDVVDTYGAIAAEVEVDPETGDVRIRRVANAYEVGKIINPLMYQGQIDGGLSQGLGYALLEAITLDEGRVTKANLHEYKLPTAADMPPVETMLLAPDLSLGITPIGEGPNCGISAAIANAIADAVSRQVDIPVLPEAVIAQTPTPSPHPSPL